MKENYNEIEILAPAGNMDSVIAAVRCGANAVYLGGTRLNARKAASNFDKTLLEEAVSYCHARNAKVHLALNTIVFDDEIPEAALSIREACESGVDALIVQDLAVAKLARELAPEIQLHASTQMAVCNLEGVLTLARLGFSRAVLARELSMSEIEVITRVSPIEIECFVHGALCMSVSGQCYISALIGGRSGNRGQCAQTCRLPFTSDFSTHALSLRDLSQIKLLASYASLGVASLKIEGRLKRPEYVAAAVTACVAVKNGREPDYKTLQAVFSRGGFTDSYSDNRLGDHMFGTRSKEDVTAAAGALRQLAALYKDEAPIVGINCKLTIKAANPCVLEIRDNDNHVAIAHGDIPQIAISAPTTEEKARISLEKTGGTPFFLQKLECDIDQGLMVPVSVLNKLRRSCLDQLLEIRGAVNPKSFTDYKEEFNNLLPSPAIPTIRVRVENIDQLTDQLAKESEYIILPLPSSKSKDFNKLLVYKDKIILEPKNISFNDTAQIRADLAYAKGQGFENVMATNLYVFNLAQEYGLIIHGDFTLNVVNHLALQEYQKLGTSSVTMSLEYNTSQNINSPIPIGIVAYGYLPVMNYRNHPSGMNNKDGFIVDRLGNKYFVKKGEQTSVMYNYIPLYLGDYSKLYKGLHFATLYFTNESPNECLDILNSFKNKEPLKIPVTRGVYQKRVL